MKRNTLTTAVVAGLAGVAGMAGVANAVNLNPDGLGQVLLYPYYTVNGGNQTLISVVNTTDNAKAVKVRFLEAMNSREVLDFNLYMSQFDVWTAAIFSSDENGPGQIVTNDNSCTVPAIAPGVPVSFRNFQYAGDFNDGGPEGLDRTRDGHIELIEMGTLTDIDEGSASAATHSAGTPNDCAQLVNAWRPGGYWATGAADEDIALPSGGLFGGGAIVDTAIGTMLSYSAEAVDAFYTDSTAPAALHTGPGDLFPNLTQVDNLVGAGQQGVSVVFDSEALSAGNPTGTITSTWGGAVSYPVDAVSALFMHSAIYNEYTVEAALNASSEWVVTYPTKRYYVDTLAAVDTPPVRPFTSEFDGDSCDRVLIAMFDREEQTIVGDVDFSPPPPQGFTALCYESNVVTFDQAGATETTILGARRSVNIETPFEFGWVSMAFPDAVDMSDEDGDTYTGLPAIGFWSQLFVNNNAEPKDRKSVV